MAGGTFPTTLDVPIPSGRLLGKEMEDHAVPKEIAERFASASDQLRSLSEAFPEGSIHRGLFYGLANFVDREHRDLSPTGVAQTTEESSPSCGSDRTPPATPCVATKES